MTYTTDAARWRALSTRDPAANNHFIYLVKSTRIYCRPTCPARLARRANILFASTPHEAATRGFRPCKRCKPDLPSSSPDADPQEKAVAQACKLIDEAVDSGDMEGVRLRELARQVGLTPRYFHKVFKERRGVSPKEWARSRMAMAKREGEKGGEMGMGTPGLVLDSPTENGGLDLDGFDFNELVDFDAESGLLMDEMNSANSAEMPMLPLDEFGDENTCAMLSWDALAPEYIGSGFRIDDRIANLADVNAASDAAMTKTTSTFEQDAALVLSSEYAPVLDGVYIDTFGLDTCG